MEWRKKQNINGLKGELVSLKGYVHYVPYVIDKDYIFLKNIIPSRKLNKKYKGV